MVVTFAFGILGAAVFAKPSVAQIEKVIGLVHGNRKPGSGVRWGVQKGFEAIPDPET